MIPTPYFSRLCRTSLTLGPVFVALALFCRTTWADPQLQGFELQSSYEEWKLPQNETMGMARIGLRQKIGTYFNAGVDSYAAVKGERGGFITLGLAGGFEYPLTSSLSIESGLFVGAGGGRGGYELTGGGLMLRENLGLKYQLNNFGSISVGMSRVDFPNGGVIKGNQLYIGYNLAFNALVDKGKAYRGKDYISGISLDLYQPRVHQFSIHSKQLSVPSGVTTDAGSAQDNFGLLGAGWRTFLDDGWFLQLESAGAARGNSRGYMEILVGGGYQLPLTEKLSSYASLSLAPAGGGAVNTGGGLLFDASIGTQYFMTRRWFLDGSVFQRWAADTSFKATGLGLKLGYQFGGQTKSNTGVLNNSTFDSHPVRVRMVNQTYTKASENWRNRPDQNVDNLGAAVDYFIEPGWFLTGQGLGAYGGDAGAYMTGLLGTGVRARITKNIFAELEGLVGAAGGGGLNTGGGLVYQANLGLGYQLNKNFEVMGTIGQMKAAKGEFHANVYGVSLAYKFNAMTFRK
jgi:hypothetical protein